MFREISSTDSVAQSGAAGSPEPGLPSAGGDARQRTDGERSTTPSTGSGGPKGAGRATGGFLNRFVGPSSGVSSGISESKRAQTSIDFVVGMSVFLLTVAFVVAFLPGAFEPFTAGGEGDVLAADRTAGLLAEQTLADPAEPGVFDADCTAEFFDADGNTGGCQFDADASDLDAALGLGPATEVNVTVEENGTVRSAGGVALRAGPTPPESEGVVVSRRVVLLDGEESELNVRVW